MNRGELIKNLRACANNDPRFCKQCSLDYGYDCVKRLMRAAANMLEVDREDTVITESAVGQLAKLNEKLDVILQGDKPQKTADEMFRELGYEKENLECGAHIIQYLLKNTGFGIAHRITIVKGYGASASVAILERPDSEAPCDFLSNEIRAVCKLLDEMGAE